MEDLINRFCLNYIIELPALAFFIYAVNFEF